ncbi:hypothetical protein EhV403 [Emiliania huxleyi virus 86]|uniref:Viral late gene transcription factor 3 zinc ribbon domain-containing protein n=1 Tax=Emiliania huxleyi virus 86 (isolate United Kingdom/English Channel/1999) TaxID=654925 RepID=Q4A276_EHV8U|nr:hypothetical protein EhV403 [Emiliania huxleyi virus 86]AEO97939.1 hypothetical protein ENVG_00041 [Emiliania huxleyi virus 84]AEP15143.1 hypothetical protein EOVG_00206 [Emiliania huxleyi virus 88]AHA56027.1 hypothetical protein EhV164_00440 [Emiliania huxleyi virus 164]UKZ11428.1 hypothetical protein EhVM1_000413 [Emiliania huxleyi virus M1]CAZ69734.1 conserved hypothetical protein [Emiliania huxleyi virus 99B1]|mmetsp:Transcript_22183/g.63035  ORF Transcript_22183/g.63035 Transcript_22183/m.63035 type:complete len:379 (-) Transcript_22183:2867-4003(-)
MPIKRTRQPVEVVTLSSVIEKAENDVKDMSNSLDDINQKIGDIDHELSKLPNNRCNILKRKVITNTRKQLVDEVDKIKNDIYVERLELLTSKYTISQNRMDTAIAIANKKPKHSAATTATDTCPDKHKLTHEYNAIVNGAAPIVKINNDDSKCIKCGGPVLMQAARSLLNCQECGYSAAVLDATASAVSFGDEVVFNQSFSYKRSNHFTEWLIRTQAKETYVVPDDVIKKVMEGLALRNVHPDEVDQHIVLDILKKNKMKSKTYRYTAQITMKCTGVPPPRLTSEMDQLAGLIFIAIQEPFNKYMPADRKNFLSYSYCIYRIYELMGADDLLPTLSLLSGTGKIPPQDAVMKKIYNEMEWDWPGDMPEKMTMPKSTAE